jgi:hypothetical protein
MSLNDNVFKDVCAILRDNKIKFWVCHGTLLGIIRENRLLPWDHDIDFAVWEHQTDKSHIIDIMRTHGYQQEIIIEDMDCLHFMGADKKIDISFYKIANNTASIKWAIGPTGTFGKLLVLISKNLTRKTNSFSIDSGTTRGLLYFMIRKFSFRGLLYFMIRKFSLLLGLLLSHKFKNVVIKKAMERMTYTGYSYPMDIMKLKYIDYAGIKIPVPADSEACLQHTYGKDWKTPKINYIWYEEAENLIDLSN